MGQDHVREELERRYDRSVSRSLAGVFRTTLDGRILECNDAMARMLGYQDVEEMLSTSAVDLYASREDRERFIDTLRRTRKLVNYEITLKHRSGRSVEVLENVFLDEDDGGEPTIHGTVIDITAFRQAELEQRVLMESYRSLVEHMRDGLLLVHKHVIRYANPAALELADNTLLGTDLVSLLHTDHHALVRQLFMKAEAPKGTGPWQVRLVNGREVMLFATRALFEGEQALQVTLQDHRPQQELIQERLRLQIAQEVNDVLRREIQQHRRTQDELQRSKRFAQSLVDSSLDMILAADPNGCITQYNPAAAMRFGWEPEEIMGLNTQVLYADPEQYARVQHEMDAHGIFTGEILNVTKEGEVFTAFLAASRLFDADGALVGAMGVSRDITRMKEDQEALRLSEERYRDLFENATDLIMSVDHDGRLLYLNQAAAKALGLVVQENVRSTIDDVLHPEHSAILAPIFRGRSMPGDKTDVRVTFRGANGKPLVAEGTINVRREGGRIVATRAILRDITHALAAEELIERHEAKLRALFESSDHMFWTVDPQIRITSYNRGYADMIERLHGTRPEVNNDPGKPRKRFASEEYHAFWEDKYAQAFAGTPVRFETDLVDRNAHRVCNEIFLSPVFDPGGRVKEVFGVGHEITEQKVAQDLVREQAARLRAIFESSANMMIWTLDRELRITSFNVHFRDTMEQQFGLTFKVGDAFVNDDTKRFTGERFETLLARYKAALKGKPQQFEAQVEDREGQPAWVENFLNPIMVDGRVQEVSCLAYGITDRKQAQMELIRSLTEKEVLLKEVHHRVKNNLQIVSSIFSLQTAHAGDDIRIQGLLRDSRDRIRSMAFIHESLYQTKDFNSIDLKGYIEGLVRNLMMSYSLSTKVELHTELAPLLLDLDQAIPCGLILNELISNALKHAFPDDRGGSIRIGLEEQDDRVRITVADDGVGLPEGFDAQRDGNLGLELVHTLVAQLDGDIKAIRGTGVTYLLTFERTKKK